MNNRDPDFHYENLKKHDRQELERIKLAQDISTHHERLALEKRKLRNENTRLYVIAVLTAVISFGTSYIFKVKDHEFAEKNAFREQIAGLQKEFRTASDDSKRRDAACELGSLNDKFGEAEFTSIISNYKSKCEQLATLLTQEREELNSISLVDTDAPVVKDLGTRIDDLEKKEVELKAQLKAATNQQKKEALQKEIKDVSTGLQSVIDRAPSDYKSAVNATAQLQQNTREQIQILTNEPDNTLGDNGEVLWLKEDYYVIYEQVRVLLQDLDKGGEAITIQVCEVGDNGTCGREILNRHSLKRLGSVKVQTTSGWYEITFQDIGKAGRNPLTPAAFILAKRVPG